MKKALVTNETIQSIFMPLELLYLIMHGNLHVMSIFNQINKYWHTKSQPAIKGILFKIFLLHRIFNYKEFLLGKRDAFEACIKYDYI